MSKKSKDLRRHAATALRRSRNGGTAEDKAKSRRRAAAYKALAQNEEWLGGEKERSKKRK